MLLGLLRQPLDQVTIPSMGQLILVPLTWLTPSPLTPAGASGKILFDFKGSVCDRLGLSMPSCGCGGWGAKKANSPEGRALAIRLVSLGVTVSVPFHLLPPTQLCAPIQDVSWPSVMICGPPDLTSHPYTHASQGWS